MSTVRLEALNAVMQIVPRIVECDLTETHCEWWQSQIERLLSRIGERANRKR